MSKEILAVIDSDLGYVDRFVRYVKKKRNLPFSIVGFSSLQALELYLQRNHVSILVLSEELFNREEGLSRISEQVETMILSGSTEDFHSIPKRIYKYKRVDAILSDLLSICQIEMKSESLFARELPVIGVFSPVLSRERQLFSLATAEIWSREKLILYISFDRFSGLHHFVNTSPKATLSDVIYYYKTGPKNIRERLSDCIYKLNDFDIIFPPSDMEDLDLLDMEQWRVLLLKLLEFRSYDLIVLDLPDVFRRPEQLAGFCKGFLIPVVSDGLTEERMKELKDYFLDKEEAAFFERIREIELSDAALECSNDPLYGNLKNYLSPMLLEQAEEFLFRFERERL